MTFNTTITTRGFTGHEMVDPVGLVHMNGRVYDPELGRFLSADPHVQDLSERQGFNRYSYVLNNPLSYTDPSGYFFDKLFKSIGKALGGLFRAIGSALKTLLQNPIIRGVIQAVGCALTAAATASMGCVAISAALTLASGGSVLDALKSAGFAFASMAVTSWISSAMDGLGSGLSGDAGPMKLGGPTGGRIVTESLFIPTATQLPTIYVTSAPPINVVAQEVAQAAAPGGWWSFEAGQVAGAASALTGYLSSSWEALARIPGDVKNVAESAYRRPLDALHAATGWHPGAGSLAGGVKLGGGAILAIQRAPLHHIMTNKNAVSATSGGPWTPKFKDLAAQAGVSLDDSVNLVRVPGHVGPHPAAYHSAVYDRLVSATDGLTGAQYREQFLRELDAIRRDVANPGSALNQLITR